MAGRAAFNSKIGFVMAAVGSAVGLGNLWRFPYLAATNGGATFLLLYLVLLFLIGIPALMAEMAIGRHRQANAVDALHVKGWGWLGFVFIAAAALLLSYYSVIAGWSIRYMFEAFTSITDAPPYFGSAATAADFWASISVGPAAILTHLIFMAATLFIVVRGVAKGIEKANLIMMPLLFATVIGLVIYGNLQPGAGAGRAFYLEPELSEVRLSTLVNAAGQTFFSIGLGLGTMLTYSSYLGKDTDLQKTGLTIAFSDTMVAVLAGLMVFPLLFSVGLGGLVNPENSGSVGGLFIVIPTAFASVGTSLGTLFSGIFFLMLTFAAISSAISLLEVGVSYIVDRHPKIGRVRAVLLLGIPVYVFGLISAIDLDFLTLADNLVSKVLLLFGGFMLSIYVGWIRPSILDELSVGVKGRDIGMVLRPMIRFALPAFLGVLLVLGFLSFLIDLGILDPGEGSFLAELTT